LSWCGEKRSWKEKERIADIYTWKGEQMCESSQFCLHCVMETVCRGLEASGGWPRRCEISACFLAMPKQPFFERAEALFKGLSRTRLAAKQAASIYHVGFIVFKGSRQLSGRHGSLGAQLFGA
jgi:hypothetical protein